MYHISVQYHSWVPWEAFKPLFNDLGLIEIQGVLMHQQHSKQRHADSFTSYSKN